MAKKSPKKSASKSSSTPKSTAPKKAPAKKAPGKKAPMKTSAKKSTVNKSAEKSASAESKKTSAKKTSVKASAKPAPKPATKTSTKAASGASPASSVKKASESAVAQVASALKSVANRVTNAFSGSPSETDKKKVLKTKTTDLAGQLKLFAPLDDRIVVSRDAVETRTAGGIYIPDSAGQEKPNRGRVLVVGPGHRDKKGRLRPLDVKKGDTVLFSQWTGSEIKIDDEEFVLIRESDVLGVVNE